MDKIQSMYDALVNTLVLSITAPTHKLSEECAAMADDFSAGMNAVQIEQEKMEARHNIRKKETMQ